MTLLHDMRQFVRENATSRACPQRIVTLSKYNIPSDRVCKRIDCPRRLRRLGIGVDTHSTKIMSEARLEESAGGRV